MMNLGEQRRAGNEVMCFVFGAALRVSVVEGENDHGQRQVGMEIPLGSLWSVAAVDIVPHPPAILGSIYLVWQEQRTYWTVGDATRGRAVYTEILIVAVDRFGDDEKVGITKWDDMD